MGAKRKANDMEEEGEEAVHEAVEAIIESTEEGKNIIEGRPVSGRVWKKRQTERTSSTVRNGTPTLKSSWETKEAKKIKEKELKEFQKTLKEDKAAAKQAERERIAEQNKRRAAAALRNSSFQTLKNQAKIKKMTKKQLRQIKKTQINKDGVIEIVNAY